MHLGRNKIAKVSLAGFVVLLLMMSVAAYCDGPVLKDLTLHQPIRLAQPEDCIKFNPDQVEAKQISGNWGVVRGDMWMLDFAGNLAQAKKAVDVIKYYKMDSQCYVGRPNAPMQYYLVNGNAPAGPMQGEDAIPFNLKTIEAKQIDGTWRVVDGSHGMLDFGDSEANAKLAVNIIKKYGFSYICFVGRPNAPMMYFRKDKVRLITPVLKPGLKPGLSGAVLVRLPKVSVNLIADPKKYKGPCPTTISFKGTITADAPCEVKYVFTRSDGGIMAPLTLKFDAAGTKEVVNTWTLSGDYTGWEQLKIIAPVDMTSGKAEFRMACTD